MLRNQASTAKLDKQKNLVGAIFTKPFEESHKSYLGFRVRGTLAMVQASMVLRDTLVAKSGLRV